MEIRKSSIEQAKADFNEIKDFALKQAIKEVEGKLTPKLEEMISAALNESTIETGEVKIEVPAGQDIKVSKEDGSEVTISGDQSGAAAAGDGIEPVIEPAIDADTTDVTDITDAPAADAEGEDEIQIDMDGDGDDDTEDGEFEIDSDEDSDDFSDDDSEEAINEADEVAVVDDTLTDAPVADENPDLTQDTNMTQEEPIPNPFDAIMQKLEAIENKMGVTGTDEDGQVEIVDDEAPVAGAAPVDAAPAPAVAPEELPVQEEFMLEDEDEIVAEIIDGSLDEYNELQPNMVPGEEDAIQEIELDEYNELQPNMVPGDEDSALDEMLGVSQTVKHQASRRNEINESKIKAQYESATDELLKENASLKDTIMEYKNSFIELRKQFNEMQTFNAKLAYTNKLFMNGGLSSDEKMKISEQFDKTKTVEEAKDLFRTIVKENSTVSATKKTIEEKIKSPINSPVAPKAEPLFESAEAKRWKNLAGIKKDSE